VIEAEIEQAVPNQSVGLRRVDGRGSAPTDELGEADADGKTDHCWHPASIAAIRRAPVTTDLSPPSAASAAA
jgi:hypothetical protein